MILKEVRGVEVSSEALLGPDRLCHHCQDDRADFAEPTYRSLALWLRVQVTHAYHAHW